jgi:nitroimidazol reductase NimA-like FMN-containing flavoprotein (pyridoxamine 5'-phosphate oxidase superfamily)
MKIISAHPGASEPMTQEQVNEFLVNRKDLLLRMGFIDEKGEPNVTPTGYYFDEIKNRIYVTTSKTSKKVQSLNNNAIIGFCIDDPTPPYKGVKGKGMAVTHEDIAYNKDIIMKFIDKNVLDHSHPAARFMLSQIESGNNIIIEIIPRYYSTWLSAVPKPK